MSSPRLVAAVLALSTVASSGCLPWSRTIQGPPASYHPEFHGAPSCTTSAPGRKFVDGFAALAAASGTYLAATIAAESGGDEPSDASARNTFSVVAVVGLLGTLMHLDAIRVGSERTARCQEAHRVWNRALAERKATPTGAPPSAMPPALPAPERQEPPPKRRPAPWIY